GAVDLARLNADLADMERQLTAQFAADHLDAAKVTFQRDGDLRYVGQGYELKIRLPTSAITPEGLTGVWKLFHEAHQREYGHFFADNPIEIVNVRVMGAGAMPKLEKLEAPKGGSLKAARIRTGQCIFRVGTELKAFETAFYRRHLLPAGARFDGPAIRSEE